MHCHATAESMPFLHVLFTLHGDGTCFHTFFAKHFTMPVVVDFATVVSLFGKRGNRKAGLFWLEMVIEQCPD